MDFIFDVEVVKLYCLVISALLEEHAQNSEELLNHQQAVNFISGLTETFHSRIVSINNNT